MNDQQWFEYHLDQLLESLNKLEALPEFAPEHISETDELFLENFQHLIESMSTHSGDWYAEGQDVINQLVRLYPQHTHLASRDLFWFFGGDCLHFLDDEEIEFYQNIEELRFQAEQQGLHFDYEALKDRFGKTTH
ncbi:PA2817 family protein [Pokkaliibacter sp. MBI-7]|uniref:PA2817 family protein n=1 Tax=Pokkaliibacter sp. MBI-7 TaxID=3040600 RepID=UPI002449ACF4|nr:PA2817 family protein [Pokkaliibacter sp. MBI-7]MDH2436386.1 PA2817 family protein [Pokkaliibacter sp. MBI-7]